MRSRANHLKTNPDVDQAPLSSRSETAQKGKIQTPVQFQKMKLKNIQTLKCSPANRFQRAQALHHVVPLFDQNGYLLDNNYQPPFV